jgi:hypothetical protein
MDAKAKTAAKVAILVFVPGALTVYVAWKVLDSLRRKYVRTTRGSGSE